MADFAPIPLSIPVINSKEWTYVKDCLDTGWVSSVGSYVTGFEQKIAAITGSAHTIATVNGTAALHIALILAGVERGDEVLIPTLTFIAPVNAIAYLGAKPVFLDCDDFLNLDPIKLKTFCEQECRFDGKTLINKTTGARIKAIVPVHIFGHPVNLEPMLACAKQYNLKIIEDATESLGSTYTAGALAGKACGTLGEFGCLSFNGNKIITTGGGGMILTGDPELAKKAKYLTTQAKDDEKRFVHGEVGYNYRLSNILAAIGLAQAETLETILATKRDNFALYQEGLSSIPGLSLLAEPKYAKSNYWFYTLNIDAKLYGLTNLELMNKLEAQGVQTRPIWELNHRQKPYRDCLAYQIDKANYYHERCLSLPCSANLTATDVARVTELIKDARK